jgi:hypothetical protein
MALIVSLGASGPLSAQRGRGGEARGGGNYDVATEVTFAATVDEVRTIPGPAGGPGGLHLMVRTDAGVREVHLGPVTFTRSKNFEFARGDVITVTGSEVTFGDADVVLAREIMKGDQTLTLRDARGIPLWAGGPRGP